MSKIPQQLQAIQTALPGSYQNAPAVCETCRGSHVAGNCPPQNVGGEEVQFMEVPGRQNG